MVFFNFGKRSKLYKDLSASEIAALTMAHFKYSGRGNLIGYLLYRGLSLDPTYVPLLLGLSAYFNDSPAGRIPDSGSLLSAVILEYALSLKAQLTPEEKTSLYAERLRLLWKWGLAQYRGDKSETVPNSFTDASKFEVDEINYAGTLVQARIGKTMYDGFMMAHIAVGLRSNALILKKPYSGVVPYESRFYRTSPAYEAWLLQAPTAPRILA